MTFEELKNECQNCTKCPLCETRTNLVFGVGNPNAKLMFIGEGPGEQEDLKGEPFVGRSGKLLDEILNYFGFDRRDNIYIANIVKCRPPKNRDPLPAEAEACINWLNKQIELIKPKVIVCLGRIPAVTLIDPKFKITSQHGEWFDFRGTFITATFHPAALLRNPNLKPQAFADFKKIKEKVDTL